MKLVVHANNYISLITSSPLCNFESKILSEKSKCLVQQLITMINLYSRRHNIL